MNNFKETTKRMFAILMLTFSGWPMAAWANNLGLSNVPLYLGGNSEPNIMFTLDDSGSMQWEAMPDNITFFVYEYPRAANGIYGSGDYWNGVPDFDPTNIYAVLTRSPSQNKMYYNPAVHYLPWLKSDGSSYPNANSSCAWHNPFNTAKGCRDLTTTNSQTASGWYTTGGWQYNATKSFWPAVYFRYNGGNVWNAGNYTEVKIKSTTPTYSKAITRTDCAGAGVCTYAEEIQNFANWYTYYRSRVLTSRAGVGRAFAQQGQNMRIGFAAINQSNKTIDGITSPGTIISGVRHFGGADRTNWFNQLYGHAMPAAGTPLRQAMDDVGQYFMRSDNPGPWGETPGTNDTTSQSTCRQSYHILMTDGYWNSAAARTSGARKNVDNKIGPSITTPTSYQYTPAAPYKDAYSNTLADVSMYYWNRDLRPTLANQVPTNVFDSAYWQHMVNFTVGLGVNGSLNPATDWVGLQAGTTNWPSGSSNQIDDLWHAAVDSRGAFFSASDPAQFATALSGILSNISGRTSSAAQVAIDSNAISTSRNIYQAKFDSSNWTGTLLSLPINLITGVVGVPTWDAQVQVSAQNYDTGRKIVTYDPVSGGMPFRWTSLATAQKSALNTNPDTGSTDGQGQSRLDYIRGKAVAGFRPRPQGVLGDLVHSSPVFVGAPNGAYPDNWGAGASENSKPYSSFRNSNVSRQGMVYVGSNDGMLHAFDAATGNETFAYVPNAVFANLNKLTSTSYANAHQFYVDGSPTIADVFFAGVWHTVLVGGLRAGGQAVYALNITDPSTASEASMAAGTTSKVMWEFTDKDDADLGYTYSKPNIVRLHNGKWAAIFGGGYNNMVDNGNDGAVNDSTTGNAALYIVDIETGTLIKKIDTGQGLAQSTTTPQYPNGLSTPLVVDINGDSIADYIFAGDLQGNVWKFDVTALNPNSWDVAYKQGSAPVPVFTATDTGGARQPITARVDAGLHPSQSGLMIYFGTGKYLELSDNTTTGQPNQTFYGIWDKGSKPPVGFSRNDLLQQQIKQEVPTVGLKARVVSRNTIFWHTGSGLPTGSPPATQLGWYLDLINTDPATAPLRNYGERSISNPTLRQGRIIFTTFLPPSDPCAFGGDSWLMELDATSGGRLSGSTLDVNGDGSIDANDFVQVNFDANGDGVVNSQDKVPVSGVQSNVGATGAPTIAGGGGPQVKILSGTSGKIMVVGEDPGKSAQGRQSWIRLQ